MSLPKEPRQLMINLMYIVLTAMLALNVSAEILNAFLSLDNSIRESNEIVGRSNQVLFKSIQDQADAYPQYRPFEEKATLIQQYTADFCRLVEAMKTDLIAASGGLDEDQRPLGKKNKEVTTRLFVEGGKGMQLHDSVWRVREQLLNLIPDTAGRQQLLANIPLKIDPLPEGSDKKDWADFTFRQMPVAAILPLLSKFQSDARVTETSLLNHLANIISAKPVHDEYDAIVSTDKSYVIRGESLQAEVFLGAYSSTTDNIVVRVNGWSVPVRNGKAVFDQVANDIGTHQLDVEITARDPRDETIKTYRRKMSYEVGERSVTTSADKMNVFYMGVDNPLSVSAAGIPSAEVRVQAEGANISRQSNGKYIVKPTAVGAAKITVSGGGLTPSVFHYRVKPIPTPVAKLGDQLSATLSPNLFKAYDKIYPHLDNFDFDAKCEIQGFELTRVLKNGDVLDSQNKGGHFNEQTRRLVDQATRGDIYYFDKIKATCPGDQVGRKLNGLVFKIH